MIFKCFDFLSLLNYPEENDDKWRIILMTYLSSVDIDSKFLGLQEHQMAW